jgi:DNA primase
MPGGVDFAAVKHAVSLAAVLEHYRGAGRRRNRDRLECRGPIHGGERDDSFRANLGRNVFHCFACQAGGDVLDLVAALERCSLREAARRLEEWFGVGAAAVRPTGQRVREGERGNPPLRFALSGVDAAHPYLAGRGIDQATAEEFGVGYYGGPGLLSGRIVIPIANGRGERVAYAGRALAGGRPKYKLPAGFRKGRELFNVHRAAAGGSRSVIVVEGYFDCLRVHQAGRRWVVALRGSSLAAEQEAALLARFERVVLLLDGAAAGRAASQAIAARLSARCELVVVALPDGAQPDQLSLTEIQQLLSPQLASPR